ncbi:MAG: sporulation protein YqfD [Eubacteriales bacterium]|nr:sporulation protein YqfD [Eubacteriales bacterium]
MKKSSFSAHKCRIKIEGFEIDKLISACIDKKIHIKDIKFTNNLEAIMTVKKDDVNNINKLAKNKYRVTVLSQAGYIYALSLLIGKKALIAGLAVFIIAVYYQSMFISEVRIYGYEKLTESEIRTSLMDVGIYEGAKKFRHKDQIEDAKIHLYQELAPLAFVEIHYRGGLAEITLAEGNRISPKQLSSENAPCDIVAEKDGYIHDIIVKQGVKAIEPGEFVTPGQVLISGFVPIKYTTYGEKDENAGKYVHAEGIVTVKAPHRFKFYITPDIILSTSGGDTVAIVRNKNETDYELVKRVSDKMVRRYIKEKLQDKAYITNKSLNFRQKENIIEVDVLFEATEEIGIEQEIMNDT